MTTSEPHRTLLRGGTILTMDPDIGDIVDGELLIAGTRIAGVGHDLGRGPEADGEQHPSEPVDEVIELSRDQIVLPGLIDGHIHLWETPLRGLASHAWNDEYFDIIHPLSGRFRPGDLAAATRAGASDLLRHGVTTVLDFCHSVNSPDHADASVEALTRAGIRAVFGYSFRDRPEVDRRAFHSHAERIRDARRVHDDLRSSPGLVSLAIALNNLGHVPAEDHAAELACARDLGVLSTIHSLRPWEISEMHARGQLGSDLMWVHCNSAADEELDLLRDHGGAVAVTPEIEVGYIGLYPLTGRLLRRDIPLTLGVDLIGDVAPDALMQARVAVQAQRKLDVQTDFLQGRRPRRSERVPTLDGRGALELVTSAAARALGLEDEIGTLTPGKAADVLVLDTAPFGIGAGDPGSHVVRQASRRDVDRVWVAGRERVRGGRLLDTDVDRLRADLDAARAHVLGT